MVAVTVKSPVCKRRPIVGLDANRMSTTVIAISFPKLGTGYDADPAINETREFLKRLFFDSKVASVSATPMSTVTVGKVRPPGMTGGGGAVGGWCTRQDPAGTLQPAVEPSLEHETEVPIYENVHGLFVEDLH